MNSSIILMTDSYKSSHYKQYPPDTEYVFSYIESRGGVYDKTLMFGLQYFLKKYLSIPITQSDINYAEYVFTGTGVPFNKEGWQYILNECNGYIPVCIKAVPEGTVVDNKNVLVTIVNTDPNVPWITSLLETSLLRAVWYGSTVATQSYYIKKDIKRFLELTSDYMSGLPFKLHDFGARGVSSSESATIGGMAHLCNFSGTDTIESVVGVMEYYNEDISGFSIPASEHSTITSWGKDSEKAAFSNMIKQFGDTIYACVSDSYDMFKAMDTWKELEPEIIKGGGTLVIRPDSGNPLDIVTGITTTPYEDIDDNVDNNEGFVIEGTHYKVGSIFVKNKLPFRIFKSAIDDKSVIGIEVSKAEFMGVVEYAMELFGYTINTKGYKVLPDHIRIIQGDGVNKNSIVDILSALECKKISADNISFGMGGKLLQGIDRDTQKFAMKCSAIKIKGKLWKDVYKDPVTDPGKTSKRGVISLFKDEDNHYYTLRVDNDGNAMSWTDKPVKEVLQTVFMNGVLDNEISFKEVRENTLHVGLNE